MRCKERLKNFNPRTPRGVRQARGFEVMTTRVFQSTHPARGATLLGLAVHAVQGISIHAPREGCDADWSAAYFVPAISIHAPREGCDNLSHQLRLLQVISIHAPREGCDFAAASLPLPSINFNPRTPRGVRLFLCILILETI